MTDPLAPINPQEVIQTLRARISEFESAYKRGPFEARTAMDLWEKIMQLKLELESTHRLLTDYWNTINGLIRAQFPAEYQNTLYPRIQQMIQSSQAMTAASQTPTPSVVSKSMLDVAREVLLERKNQPISIPALIHQMKQKQVNFTARNPEKSLAQTMRSSGKFEIESRGLYRLKQEFTK